jgi:hypothetical protein
MNRFLKTFVLLIVALVSLASGVSATLDCLGRSPAQNSFTWYDERGGLVVAYDGEQALAQKFPRPVRAVSSFFVHRT